MNRQQRILLYCSGLVIFMAGATVGDASTLQPAPRVWHENAADIRFPLSVSNTWELLCDDYLANLKPVEVDGLSFDPVRKSVSSDKGGSSAVFAVGPHHRWLTFHHKGGGSRVFADGRQIHSGFAYSRQTMNPQVAIPEGTKKLKIEVRGTLQKAGFTLGPRVAKAQVCLPGMNSADYRAVVYTASGKQVACRTIWAGEGDPVTVLFDCSSGEKNFYLYPVPASHEISPPEWTPPAGLILETRYLNVFAPSVVTFEGFNSLWNRPARLAGRQLMSSPQITALPPFPPSDSKPGDIVFTARCAACPVTMPGHPVRSGHRRGSLLRQIP